MANYPDARFWHRRRVFVTGHTGFKGSWLSLWLQSLAAEVCGFALSPNTNPALFVEANVASGMQSTIGDIRDFSALLAAMKAFQPDLVFHLAAQPLVRMSYLLPLDTFSTNVIGTVHVLEAARQVDSVRAIVNVTTDKCYENREWIWPYRETDPMGGFDPYSASKGCSELVTSAYRRSFMTTAGKRVASARAGNVIGGGDWSQDRLLPDILKAFQGKHAVTIRNPEAVRPWQHVLEPLAGYLRLAECLFSDGDAFADAWNFGPSDGDARSVRWIVEHVAALWPEPVSWKLDRRDGPHEATHLKLDTSKARSQLGWSPHWNLQTSLSKIVEWHTAWIKGDNPRDLCVRQVNEYMKHLKNCEKTDGIAH